MGARPIGPAFRREVEAFLCATRTKVYVLREGSAGAPSFVERLRRGASVRLPTVERVRAWMAAHSNEAGRGRPSWASRRAHHGPQPHARRGSVLLPFRAAHPLPAFGLRIAPDGTRTIFVRVARELGTANITVGTAVVMTAAEASCQGPGQDRGFRHRSRHRPLDGGLRRGVHAPPGAALEAGDARE